MNPKTSEILGIFEEINAIPRCSKQEEMVCRWLQNWAKENQFKVRHDTTGNLVIVVPATAGCENAPGIILQGHMDMVCEKTPDSDHDFSQDPIRHLLEGDWLRAHKTTLGADNGIAMAIGLALARDKSLVHPKLELLFTVDEETGLIGANSLAPDFIQGEVLLNLDSEEEGVFTVGCAGGKDTYISLDLDYALLPSDSEVWKLKASGMRGGHSGIDIHRSRANANKVLARALHHVSASLDIRLISIDGGTAHNAIPRDAEANVACASKDSSRMKSLIAAFQAIVTGEYFAVDPSVTLSIERTPMDQFDESGVTAEDTRKVISLIMALPHGVSAMSPVLDDLVETSSNLATIRISDRSLQICTSQRSSVMSKLEELTLTIKSTAFLAGAQSETNKGYPAWQPNLKSPLLKRCREIYERMFQKEAEVKVVHAGLECGVIGSLFPGIEMISFGPTVKNPHSPDEKLYVPSIKNTWDFLVELLQSFCQ
jgi:dipeptidase D